MPNTVPLRSVSVDVLFKEALFCFTVYVIVIQCMLVVLDDGPGAVCSLSVAHCGTVSVFCPFFFFVVVVVLFLFFVCFFFVCFFVFLSDCCVWWILSGIVISSTGKRDPADT